MHESSSTLSSAIRRLEDRDATLTSIDLRGNGARRRGMLGSATGTTDDDDDDDVVVPHGTSSYGASTTTDGTTSADVADAPSASPPRSGATRFATALASASSSRRPKSVPSPYPSSSFPTTPSSSSSSSWCRLSSLSLHNRAFDESELRGLYGALSRVSSLEVLVIFNHDVGDVGASMLMEALTRGISSSTDVTPKTTTATTGDMKTPTFLDDADCGRYDANDANDISALPTMLGLRELYLSHCGIGCMGARAIACALERSHRASTPRRFATTTGTSTTTTATEGGGGGDENDDGDDDDYYDHVGDDDSSRLKCLQVLSLGSNVIGNEGTARLAVTFGRYPPLQRLVLHGNGGTDGERLRRGHHRGHHREQQRRQDEWMVRRAFVPAGWEDIRPLSSSSLSSSMPMKGELDPSPPCTNMKATTTVSDRFMSELVVPLTLPYVRRRWINDRVLIRPHDVLRRRLREVTITREGGEYGRYPCEHLECVPDMLSYLGTVGTCRANTSLSSSSTPSSSPVSFDGSKIGGEGVRRTMLSHSSGWEVCRACSAVHLNDVYGLLLHVPHLVAMLRVQSTSSTCKSGCIRCK